MVKGSLILAGMSTATVGTANHPFRATLPSRVLHRLPVYEPEVRARLEVSSPPCEPAPDRWRLTTQDVKYFLIAYIACFLAISAWIS